MTSKQASNKKPEEKQPAGLWRGIAFGSLLTLTLGAGAAFVVYQNMPQALVSQSSQNIVYKVPVVSADRSIPKTPPKEQVPDVKQKHDANLAKLADIEGVTLALGEAFKLETQRIDALIEFAADQQDTINKMRLRLDDLERRNLEEAGPETAATTSPLDHKIMLLFSAYQQSLPLSTFSQQTLTQAEQENASAEMVEALKQIKETTTPRVISLSEVYAYLNQLEPPIVEATTDVSKTEQGWQAKIGNLVSIRKIDAQPTNVSWETALQKTQNALRLHDYANAVTHAKALDEDFAAFLQRFADQRHAFAALIHRMITEGGDS